MATWTPEDKYSGAASITYDAAIIYDSPLYNYNGQLVTAWTSETKN